MSSNLVYKLKPETYALGDDLKYILQKKKGLPREFDVKDIPYLNGLRDAGIEGSIKLIEAIKNMD